jgi:hypothetical protein
MKSGGGLNIWLWVCFGTMLRKLSMHKQIRSLVMGVCFGTTLKNYPCIIRRKTHIFN